MKNLLDLLTDLGDENNDSIPDSEPDSEFSISTVHSSDISNLGEESGKSGTDEIRVAEGTQNFGGITMDNFTQESGPKFPNGFDMQWWHQLNILSFILRLRCLN